MDRRWELSETSSWISAQYWHLVTGGYAAIWIYWSKSRLSIRRLPHWGLAGGYHGCFPKLRGIERWKTQPSRIICCVHEPGQTQGPGKL